MYEDMKLNEFKKEWLFHFASNIPKKELHNKVIKTGNYIWHIFSWGLIAETDYSSGAKAKLDFDNSDKSAAWYVTPFEDENLVQILPSNLSTASRLDEETEVYVVAKDFSWTYIKTHEVMCGPYFYKKENVCKK